MNDAHLYLVDNQLRIQLPFLSKFVKKFRKDTYNTFIWDKANKYYYTEYSTYSLRCAYKTLSEFFNVTVDDNLHNIIKNYEINRSCVWEPTLVKTKCGDYYIACINESLYEVLKDTDLSVDDLKCLNQLSKFAVNVPDNLLSNLPQKIASTRIYTLTEQMYKDNRNCITRTLQQLGITTVLLRHKRYQYVDIGNDLRSVVFDVYDFSSDNPSNVHKNCCYITTKGDTSISNIAAEKILILQSHK